MEAKRNNPCLTKKVKPMREKTEMRALEKKMREERTKDTRRIRGGV